MSARTKVTRLFGAVLVTLALVAWLGASPASATGGGNDKGSSNAKGSAKETGNNGKKDDKSDAKSKKSDRANNESDREDDDDDDGDDEDAAEKQRDDDKSGNKRTSGDNGGGNQKVTLCHRTNSETNPYVRITVSINSVVKGHGHDGHGGPIFQAGMKSAKQKWGDIIPSFTYPTKGGDTATYGGKNWPAGQAILDAGCAVETEPTTTTSTTPTTSDTPTVTASTTPTVTDTVTPTVPGPSGMVTVTETVTVGPGTSVLPTKIGNTDDGNDGDGDDLEVLGTKSGPLAATGLDLPLGAALGLSFALLLAGGALMVAPGRPALERNRRH